MLSFNLWHLLCKLLDAFLICYVPFRLFRPRNALREKRAPAFALCFVLLGALYYCVDLIFQRPRLIITLCLYVTTGLATCCLLFRERFWLKTLVLCACVSVEMLAHYFIYPLLYLFMPHVELWSWQATLLNTLFFAGLSIFMHKSALVPESPLPTWYGVSMSLFMLIMSLATDAITEFISQIKSPLGNVLIVGFVIFALLYLYLLFFQIIRECEQKNRFQNILHSREVQRKNMEENEQVYNSLCCLRHELKNHIFYMQTLIEQDRIPELEEYFRKLYHEEYDVELSASGNNSIDALFNQKRTYAQAKNIPLILHVKLPEELLIETSDLCTVLSNLLDNAIEACATVKEPSVQLSVQSASKYIHILCRNSVVPDLLEKNPDLVTAKAGNHGLGLQIVRSIVEKYDGMFSYSVENETFNIQLMMRNIAVFDKMPM